MQPINYIVQLPAASDIILHHYCLLYQQAMEYYSALAKRRQDEKQQQQKELSAAAESLSLTPRHKSSRLSVDADAKLDAQSSTNQTCNETGFRHK